MGSLAQCCIRMITITITIITKLMRMMRQVMHHVIFSAHFSQRMKGHLIAAFTTRPAMMARLCR